jgi:hypothetical protein
MATATKPPRPGRAWVWKGGRWQKPPVPGPAAQYSWNNNRGWVKKGAASAAKPNPAMQWLAENYGLTSALIDADPTNPATGFTMREAFAQIQAEKITDPNRAAEIIAKTNWYKQHGMTALQKLALKKSQPGVWKRELQGVIDTLRETYTAAGITIPPVALRQMALDQYVFGLSDASMRKALFANPNVKTGSDVTDEQALRSYAASMGVSRSDDWFKNATRALAFKQRTLDDFKQQMQKDAIGRTPYWADQIKNGQTVEELAAGYLNDVQTLLENPNLDLKDALVKKALTSLGKDGKPAPVPLWQFEQMVRQDPRWKQTKNGQAAYANVGMNVLKSFGFME